jgi:hypothetical protein
VLKQGRPGRDFFLNFIDVLIYIVKYTKQLGFRKSKKKCYPQTHLESVIILDRNRSYLSELQLRRNLVYNTLGLLSPTKK